MSIDSEDQSSDGDAIADIGQDLEDAVAEQLGVDRSDIRVRVEHQSLHANCREDYLTVLKADWIGDGPAEVRER